MIKSALKKLSENDVGETNSHQAGFLIPKEFVKNGLFEELTNQALNPRLRLKIIDITDGTEIYGTYIFYNNRLFGGTKLEYRLTGLTKWIKNHGVRYFNELTNMAQLTEEVGEVARIIARRYGEQSEKESDKNKDLGEELADVVFVVLCLANQTGIDLQAAFDKKMDLKTNRDHDRHHNNDKLK
jgi:NTP pyrophosphatase (non-canonical NTP hydrolase)